MTKQDYLVEQIEKEFSSHISSVITAYDEVTVECEVDRVMYLLTQFKDHASFAFDQLIDLCAVDYLRYGKYDWETESATESGFSRAVERNEASTCASEKPRFAVVYHLLSTEKNHRVRVRISVNENHMFVPSVHKIWKGASWFEREAYDLYGVLFENHPDLRRILTDYGFIGHPFRKDFPLSGHVEMRYDAHLQKVIYEPVEIEPRILVPKVIRDDSRYLESDGSTR